MPKEQGRAGNWVHRGDIPRDSFPEKDVIRKKVNGEKQALYKEKERWRAWAMLQSAMQTGVYSCGENTRQL